jgi:hypothetical protein
LTPSTPTRTAAGDAVSEATRRRLGEQLTDSQVGRGLTALERVAMERRDADSSSAGRTRAERVRVRPGVAGKRPELHREPDESRGDRPRHGRAADRDRLRGYWRRRRVRLMGVCRTPTSRNRRSARHSAPPHSRSGPGRPRERMSMPRAHRRMEAGSVVPPSLATAARAPGIRHLIMSRAAFVHAAVTSRMNLACAVARLEIHSMSLEPGPRSSVPAIVFSAFS